MQKTSIDLSIVIPCYNSGAVLEKELPLLIEYLNSLTISYEIILSNDGSRKEDIVEFLAARHHCLYTANAVNTGKGAALRNGFAIANGHIQLFTDSDLPFEFNVIQTAYDLISEQKADIVIGDRTNPQSSYYLEISWLRKMGSFLISSIASRILKNHIVDTQCGFKAFTKKAAAELFPTSVSKGFAIDFEILYLASRQDKSIEKIPVTLRTQYPSSVRVYKDGIAIISEILHSLRQHGK